MVPMTAKDLPLFSRASLWIAAAAGIVRTRHPHPHPDARARSRMRRRVILGSRLDAADRLREESERRRLWM
jgi:hypothetical protein